MRFFGWHLDFIGFSASFACAVHCMALPLLLSLGLFGGSSWLGNEAMEITLIIGSIFIASYSIGKAYWKNHRQLQPIYWLLIGIAFLLLSIIFHHETHHILTAFGGFAIAYAHFVNWKKLSCRIPSPRIS